MIQFVDLPGWEKLDGSAPDTNGNKRKTTRDADKTNKGEVDMTREEKSEKKGTRESRGVE
jgi:hypothetical protein